MTDGPGFIYRISQRASGGGYVIGGKYVDAGHNNYWQYYNVYLQIVGPATRYKSEYSNPGDGLNRTYLVNWGDASQTQVQFRF